LAVQLLKALEPQLRPLFGTQVETDARPAPRKSRGVSSRFSQAAY
jgi:hypothetical protein